MSSIFSYALLAICGSSLEKCIFLFVFTPAPGPNWAYSGGLINRSHKPFIAESPRAPRSQLRPTGSNFLASESTCKQRPGEVSTTH